MPLQEDRAVQVSQGTGGAHVVFNPLVQVWVTDHTGLQVMESNPSTQMIWEAGLGQAWLSGAL